MIIPAILLSIMCQTTTQPAPPLPAPPPSEPTLDELLGIKKPEATKPAEQARDAELEKALSPEERARGFEAAVELMGEAAQRLGNKDAGLDTQRVQEDILRKLDQLIADARKQQSKSKSSSSSSSQSQPGEQQQQQGAQSQQSSSPSQGTGENHGNGPARQEGAVKPPLAGSGAAWGNLPAHMRDSLMQGWSDRFSSVYRNLTEEYYKRLAEPRIEPGAPR